MNNEKIISCLTNLSQLDIDAVNAYEQALKHIENKSIYQAIKSFREDHLQHIKKLAKLIEKHGGNPPKNDPDLKGYLIAGFTSLRSITGTKGALKAMKTNEELTNKTYREALQEELPGDVNQVVKENYEDEKRHLAYIENILNKEDFPEDDMEEEERDKVM